MRIAYRSLAVAYALVLLAFHADAQSELFPRPAELEPAVQFWTRVYTEVDTKSGFIHDDPAPRHRLSDGAPPRRLEHAASGAGASSAPPKRRATILTKLAGGARQSLSNDEERVLKLFPEGTSNAEFRAAAGRLRFQLGQSDRFRAGARPLRHVEALHQRGAREARACRPSSRRCRTSSRRSIRRRTRRSARPACGSSCARRACATCASTTSSTSAAIRSSRPTPRRGCSPTISASFSRGRSR